MDCGSSSNAGVVSSNNIDLSKVMEKIRISYQEMLMSIMFLISFLHSLNILHVVGNIYGLYC